MDILNNEESDIYKLAILRTNDIKNKLEKTKINDLISDIKISGEKKQIILFLKAGPAKNLVNKFFKTNDCCDYCGVKKSKEIQIDRAHCNKNNFDRSSLLENALSKYYVDEETGIKIKDILRSFLENHIDIPLYSLCKTCHRNYDN